MQSILSADIGGTKTILQFSKHGSDHCEIIKKQIYASADFPQFLPLIESFIDEIGPIDAACLAVAGPVQRTKQDVNAKVTNLPWELNNLDLQNKLNIPQVYLINDFQAIGYAIEHLTEQDLKILQSGKEQKHGVRAVIGAGTGLGQAILVYQNTNYEVLGTEGGHVDFAPNSEIEVGLYQFLNNRYPHVSYERILSGQGLVNIFQFLLEITEQSEKEIHENILQAEDVAAAISQQAQANSNNLAVYAMEIFCKIYGAQAGNLALSCLANGGVYIAGGIAAKNLKLIENSELLTAFNAKGRMQSLTENMPVKVITNPEAGLLGAMQYAIR